MYALLGIRSSPIRRSTTSLYGTKAATNFYISFYEHIKSVNLPYEHSISTVFHCTDIECTASAIITGTVAMDYFLCRCAIGDEMRRETRAAGVDVGSRFVQNKNSILLDGLKIDS